MSAKFQSSIGMLLGAIVFLGFADDARGQAPATDLQKRIVTNANAAAGGSSGPSYVVSPWGAGTTTWLTDTAGNDGTRMRAATNRYYNWYWANPQTRVALAQIKTTMKADFNGSLYDAPRKQSLVDEIVRVYDAAVVRNRVRVQPPATDQAMMGFLGVRKQCLEWAVSIALASGGQARGYNSPGVALANQRPGMMLVKPNIPHAGLIVEMRKVNGITQYRLAEANAGGGWINPIGMIPWQRTVQNVRWVTLQQGDKVISFE